MPGEAGGKPGAFGVIEEPRKNQAEKEESVRRRQFGKSDGNENQWLEEDFLVG